MALLDRVPVLQSSLSLKTSRMSGFLLCLDFVLPRTVRFKAFTLCFIASAWSFGRFDMIGSISIADISNPLRGKVRGFLEISVM